MEEKWIDIETRHTARDSRVAEAAWMGFARTRLVQKAIVRMPLGVKTRKTGSIESVSGWERQITGACYHLLSFCEAHDFAEDSGR